MASYIISEVNIRLLLFGVYNMNVLITGGCGFIGSYLAKHYLSKDENVWIIDDLSTGSMKNLGEFAHHPRLIIEESDINAWPSINRAVQWADHIYHFAAVVGLFNVLAHPIKLLRTNIIGTEKILQAIVENHVCPYFILISSSSVYGHSDKLSLSEADQLIVSEDPNSLSAYAISKITDEILTSSYASGANFNYMILRLFNTIGPGQSSQYGMVVPRFVRQACSHQPITVFGSGEQTRSFCDVRDSIALMLELTRNPAAVGEIINVGQDVEITINHLAKSVKKLADSESRIEHIDYSLAYGQAIQDTKQRKPNLDKLRSLTQYQYQWTLERTIKNLIEERIQV